MIIIKWVIIIVLILTSVYLLGRIFMKGLFHELDFQLGRKFVNYINKKKEENKDN